MYFKVKKGTCFCHFGHIISGGGKDQALNKDNSGAICWKLNRAFLYYLCIFILPASSCICFRFVCGRVLRGLRGGGVGLSSP
jgi:hypothetical protein